MTAGLKQRALRAQARGIKFYGDPGHPTRMLPIYDCGDHLHQRDVGYNRLGDIIDLSLFA